MINNNNNNIIKNLKCLYLLNNDEYENKNNNEYKYFVNEKMNVKYVTFRKDDKKNLLYSTHYLYNDSNINFIYKLNDEIEKCRKIQKNT